MGSIRLCYHKTGKVTVQLPTIVTRTLPAAQHARQECRDRPLGRILTLRLLLKAKGDPIAGCKFGSASHQSYHSLDWGMKPRASGTSRWQIKSALIVNLRAVRANGRSDFLSLYPSGGL